MLGLPAGARGHQVFKFSPTGEILMTIGRPRVAGNGPDTFDRPTDVAVNADGDIFVTDGHGPNNRVVKFDRNGRFLLTWGTPGDGPGEFNQPHTITLDSRGRVFVGDRSNSRIQIFEPDGTFVAEWTQFGRPSGMFIDEDDVLYVTDSTSNSQNNPGFNAGSTSAAPLTARCTPIFRIRISISRTRCAYPERRESPRTARATSMPPMSVRNGSAIRQAVGRLLRHRKVGEPVTTERPKPQLVPRSGSRWSTR